MKILYSYEHYHRKLFLGLIILDYTQDLLHPLTVQNIIT